MLDTSIPFKNIIMRAESLSPAFSWTLPKGFAIRTYAPGDEKEWADIEVSVGEFDTAGEAESYFVRTYFPFPHELSRRCFFALSPDQQHVGTCTAWFMKGEKGDAGVIHWFGVRPGYQGLGLGKALLGRAMRLFEGDGAYPAYLHTQTWSHKAIGLYHAAGFRLMKTGTFEGNPNDYDEAVEVLRGVVSGERLSAWVDDALPV